MICVHCFAVTMLQKSISDGRLQQSSSSMGKTIITTVYQINGLLCITIWATACAREANTGKLSTSTNRYLSVFPYLPICLSVPTGTYLSVHTPRKEFTLASSISVCSTFINHELKIIFLLL